jgi:nitrogen regulatory protein PII
LQKLDHQKKRETDEMEQDAYPDMAMEIQIKKNRIEDLVKCITQGRIQGGAPPLKLEKI